LQRLATGRISAVEPEELAAALVRLKAWAEENAPEPEPPVRTRLREHLGRDPIELPIVTRALEAGDRPNFQVAIDAWTQGRDVEVVGLPVMQGYRAGLAELVRGPKWMSELEFGAVAHVTVALGERESMLCVDSGVWLVRDEAGPLVLMLKSEDHGMGERLGLEVMVAERERGERAVAELWTLMRERNVYRGRVLELRGRHFHGDEDAPLTVRSLPTISRDRIVLPAGVLERIERHAFGIAEHAERLRASGRHLRRGLLLYGPPGTGKTLTAMYLVAQMQGRTAVMLTGQSLGSVGRPSTWRQRCSRRW
jgi:ATPase family associated with various cellular activities (AAA)